MKTADTTYVADHRGLAGSGIWRHFTTAGHTNLVGLTPEELDLTHRDAVKSATKEIFPDVQIDAAAKVGGSHPNDTHQANFMSENFQMQVNHIDLATFITSRILTSLLPLFVASTKPKKAEPVK